VRRASRHSGFTLLEIAVALAILGVGVVTCLQIFSGSIRLQDRASRETRAVLNARAAMDALLFQPFVKDQESERWSDEGFRTRLLVRPAGPDDGVEGFGDEEEFDVQDDFELKFLQVEVAWQDGAGMNTYTLRSIRISASDDFF